MPNQLGRVVAILILAVLAIGASSLFIFGKSKDTTQESPQMATHKIDKEVENYGSGKLNINFRYPKNAVIEEKANDIIVKLDEGEIQIRRIGTNFENIKDYIDNLKHANKMEVLSEDRKVFNGSEGVVLSFKISDDSSEVFREYSLYKDGWVFKFSTSKTNLYPVLDQIVESFEYRP